MKKRQKLRQGQTRYHSTFPQLSVKIVGKENKEGFISVIFERPVDFHYESRFVNGVRVRGGLIDWDCRIRNLYKSPRQANLHYNGGRP